MNYRRWTAAAAVSAAIVSFSGAGMAQGRDGGFYATLTGLLVIPRDAELSDDGVTLETSTNTGFGVLAAAGYEISSGLRAELELGYRGFDSDKITNVGLGGASVGTDIPFTSEVDTLSVMANGIYSFKSGKLRPYAGLGLGLARHSVEFPAQTLTIAGEDFALAQESDDATVLAYQAMAGIGYALSDQAEVRLGYRYFATAKADLGGTDTTYGTHNFEIGLLYRF